MVDAKAATPRKILLVRLGAIGDVVHALPALAALRRALPSSSIHWAVETASAPILQGRSDLDAVHVIPRKEWQSKALDPRRWPSIGTQATGVLRDLRKHDFDATIDFQGNFRSGLVCRITGAPLRIGFDASVVKESSHLFYTLKIRPRSPLMHRVERNLSLLEPLGIVAPVSAPLLELPPMPAAVLPQGLSRPIAAVHAGVSAFGALKAWPPAHFAATAREFSRLTGGSSVFTFGPGEKETAQGIAAQAGDGAFLSPQTKSLAELAAIFRSVDVVCGADTGPVQVAAAAGAPVVAIFGPKDPRVYGPMGRVMVVTPGPAGPDCVPCGARRCRIPCPDGFSPCMTGIEPQRVARAMADAAAGKRA